MFMRQSHLFVYGTLRCGHRSGMSRLLAKHTEFRGYADFQGKLYDIGNYPGVVASTKSSDHVHGELYRLLQPALVLPQLDKYEEFGAGFPQPTEYTRKLKPVLTDDGATILAWVYLYNRPVARFKRISSGDYLDYASGN